MQFVMPIHELWSPETIVENINLLRSQIEWKNFKLSYDELTYQKKGYFVINLSYDKPERKSSIHIWRDKVELTSKNWGDVLVSAVVLSYILTEKEKSIFLDSIYSEFEKTGNFNRHFQELCLQVVISQYLDLIEKKVPDRLLQNTKKAVRSTLQLMLQVVEETESC